MKSLRDRKLAAVWKATHRDFKGKLNGERSIMVYRNGTCLVLLKDLTDAEIEDKLPAAVRAAFNEENSNG